MRIQLGVLSIALLATGCGGGGGGGGSAATAAMTVSGTYRGTLSDNTLGSGTITLSVAQSGSSVTGTFSDTFSANSADNNSGSFSGTLSGTSLTGTVTPSVPTSCPFNVTATVSNGGVTIAGSYAAFNCTVSDGGTFTASN